MYQGLLSELSITLLKEIFQAARDDSNIFKNYLEADVLPLIISTMNKNWNGI